MVLRLLHTVALGVPGERRGATAEFSERGRRKVPSRGQLARSIGWEQISRVEGVSDISGGVSLAVFQFRVPCLKRLLCLA